MALSSSSGGGGKEQFLREHPQYGYRDATADADDNAELEIDRMRAQEFAHMQGTTSALDATCVSPVATSACLF